MKVEIEGVNVEAIPMVWSDSENAEQGSEKQCAHCSRKVGKTCQWVHVVDGGASVILPDERRLDDSSGDMYWHPIGNTCAKKYFNGFTVKREDIPDLDI